ncbi:hypothetical protein Pfo_028860 [Paulownia fortunei]|nr:hypothetical protein Pfo_028860 [Paulownia fortunei]
MTDRQYSSRRRAAAGSTTSSSFLQKLREHAPNSIQLIGFATLTISSGILLLLTGLTLTATFLGLIFLAPLILISSPIWIPAGILFLIAATGFISFCGFAFATAAALSWLYRYFRGFHPSGSDRFDYSRTGVADTASHAKDYAREHGGYLHSKVKDAAPGA